MLACLNSKLTGGPGRILQQSLFCRISLDQVFHFPKEHFHENGLRANPSAKESAEGGGKQNNKNDKCYHCQPEDEEILRPEYFPEDDKLSFGDIELEQRAPVRFYERHCKKSVKKPQLTQVRIL